MPTAGDADRSREVERRKQAEDARPRMNLQQIQSWVDLEIQQAQRRGDFENLPGAGKPLKNLDKADPDWWIKGLIEREKLDLSAALPTVMALRQERRGYPESLAGIADEVAVRERLADYNARVLEDRRKPVVGPRSPAIAGRVDVEETLAQWRELRADQERRLVTDASEVTAAGEPAPGRGDVRGGQAWLWLGLLGIIVVVIVIWLAMRN
ncbi:J-domain-containing protein [Ornithinimicrobium cryptoxanthini]|uniref:DnaJ family domain-containing protein n=1 Tax=Ornithinimicrobium cryptoxanthini TaxID=2934161 RepID=UPI002117EAD2|nr:DUF1992 domain-containing protein [Ornithinimicrobium cryptoxanthini]